MAEDNSNNGAFDSFTIKRLGKGISKIFDKYFDQPVTYIKEKIVDPKQQKDTYPYYHRQYRRVPTIDECETEDYVCAYEANEQFRRDKRVDYTVVKILKKRLHACQVREGENKKIKCKQLAEDVEKARENYFIKYGDLGMSASVIDAYMKQKHRLIWERRNATPLTPNSSIPESF